MDDYNDIRKVLKPRRSIGSPESFRNTIESYQDIREHSRHGWKCVWGDLTIGAVAAIMVLMFIPSRLSAKKILTEAISAIRSSTCIEMQVDIRTDDIEIFSIINPDADFISHDIRVHRCDSATFLYVSKKERSVEKRTDGLYVWLPSYRIEWHFEKEVNDWLGYLKVFLSPENILESELQSAMSQSGTKYDISNIENEIILTIHSLPKGDFTNPYTLNSSVSESENIRRYVIVATTRRIKESSESIIDDGKKVEIIKLKEIDYNPSRS